MAYQVIARKWRPQRFSDMVGQEHIARTLRNAIISGRIAQAYLFVGPRGIGKTTSARIFAKALNCEHPVDGEPCCECKSCKAVASETSVDVIEIDAATHTQVEKAREICEEVMHMPIASKYKIYIIDEVHMLSKSAWNALLKTIEEPPEHAKFIFATTEVNKVLPTVISRCQRFDLKRIPTNLIAERLQLIAKTEGVPISPRALSVIARAADGGMRDAQSLLDQMISFFSSGNSAGSEISEEQALSLFGLTAPAEMSAMVQSIILNDVRSVILALHNFSENGKNLEVLFDEILVWLRGVMMSSILKNPETVIEDSAERIEIFKQLAASAKPGIVQRLLENLSSTGYLLREAVNKQIFIETLLMKAMRLAHAPQVGDIIDRLNYIRKNGELAPLDAVPSFDAIPLRSVVAVPAEKKMISEPVPVAPPQTGTAAVVEPEKTEAVPAQSVPEEQIPAKPEPMSMEPDSIPDIPVEEQDSEDSGLECGDLPAEEVEMDVDDAPVPPSRGKSVEQLKQEIKDNPVVRKAMEMFEGVLVDVHENSL